MENNKTGQKAADKRMPESRKYRMNFVDILVAILVILSVVSFFFRGQAEKLVNQMMADDTVTVGFAITDLDPTVAEQFGAEKDFTYNDETFGVLQSYDVGMGTKTILSNSPLAFKNVSDSGSRTVTGTILVTGIRKDSGFYLASGEKIAVGKTFTVYSMGQKFTILITKIG
ncbi:MAG: DUF4330 family protein [Eubacteriales bacterium]